MGKGKIKLVNRHFQWSRKKLIILMIIVAVLAILGLGGWWVYNKTDLIISHEGSSSSSLQYERQPTAEEKHTADVVSGVKGDAQNVVSSGGKIDEVVTVYENAIQTNNSSNSIKADLLFEESGVYYNAGDYSKALSLAVASDDLVNDDNTEHFIAEIYARLGQKTEAIIYYQKAISNVDMSGPLANSDIQDYQDNIKQLGGGI